MAEPMQTTCPYCKGEVPAGAVKCLHCGEWFDRKKQPSSDTAKLLFLFFILFVIGVYALAVSRV